MSFGSIDSRFKYDSCHKCTKETGRTVGCHSWCEGYIVAKEHNDRIKSEITATKEAEYRAIGFRRDMVHQQIKDHRAVNKTVRNANYKNKIM